MKTIAIPTNIDAFNQYLDNCKEAVRSNPSEGYYHVNVVAEAYNQGFSDGKKSAKKDFTAFVVAQEIEKFAHRANQIYILSKNLINHLKEQGFQAKGLFINLSFKNPSAIIVVTNMLLNNDEFVEKAYAKMFINKNIFFELFHQTLDTGFIANDNLDEAALKADGFEYLEKYDA